MSWVDNIPRQSSWYRGLLIRDAAGDIHIYPAQGTFDAQAYEAEEEVDQYLSDSSHLGSVSAPSSRLNPQPSTIRSEVPSRVIYGDFESGMQSAFSYPSGWRDRDYTQYNVLVPIMTGQGIAYQAVEEECDACRSYFFSQTRQMTDNAYRTSRHLRDSQWDIASNPAINGGHRLKDSSVGL